MYKIAYNNKKKTTVYTTYEAARQAIRKMLRKETDIRVNNQPFTFEGGTGFRAHGYSIIKVD